MARLTLERVYDTALKLNHDYRLPLNAFVTACQTYHETGNYVHVCGTGNANLAGVKCSDNWRDRTIPWSTGQCIDLNTGEHENGKDVYGKRSFRWYGDRPDLCLRDMGDLIKRKSWYQDAEDNIDCMWAYLAGLVGRWIPGPRVWEPGWATSPVYFDSIARHLCDFAPRLLGAQGKAKLRTSYVLALTRGVLTTIQRNIIEGHLRRVGA